MNVANKSVRLLKPHHHAKVDSLMGTYSIYKVFVGNRSTSNDFVLVSRGALVSYNLAILYT